MWHDGEERHGFVQQDEAQKKPFLDVVHVDAIGFSCTLVDPRPTLSPVMYATWLPNEEAQQSYVLRVQHRVSEEESLSRTDVKSAEVEHDQRGTVMLRRGILQS
jgi:hypothetical protein